MKTAGLNADAAALTDSWTEGSVATAGSVKPITYLGQLSVHYCLPKGGYKGSVCGQFLTWVANCLDPIVRLHLDKLQRPTKSRGVDCGDARSEST